MVKFVDNAVMTTATIGTGTITLGSAVAGHQSFADAGVVDGDQVRYRIDEGANWEIGLGTYTASGTTLTRTPSASSASGSAITLAGNARVVATTSAVDLITATGADTLTNKTLDDPILDGSLLDTAGNELLTGVSVGSAVNQVTVSNAATGDAPGFAATGDDTNIDLLLEGKGTGIIRARNTVELRDGASRWATLTGSSSGLDLNIDPAAANASSRLRILVDNTEIARITPTGLGVLNTSPAFPIDVTGAIRASTGVLFGTDTAAANTLDDYEEGTWTVQLYDAGTGGNASPTTVTGYYTKIGNIVHAGFGFLNDIDTTGMNPSGQLHLTLPIAALGSPVISSGSINIASLTFPTGRTLFIPRNASSGGRAIINMAGDGLANGTLTAGALTSGATDIISFQLTYRV